MTHILVATHTVADWGGVHENVAGLVHYLSASGYSVTVVAKAGKLADVLKQMKVNVICVDWEESIDVLTQDVLSHVKVSPDLVYFTPQKSRQLALQLHDRWNVDLFASFHGFYPDSVATWRDIPVRFHTVAPVLTEMLTGYAQVDAWRVDTIPNGIPDHLFERDAYCAESKLQNGIAEVVLASRLEADKTKQLSALEKLVQSVDGGKELLWRVTLFGDGKDRELFRGELNRLSAKQGNLEFDMPGWAAPQVVQEQLVSAYLAVGSGRFAMSAIALGTPAYGVGKYATTGLSIGEGLDIGLWSNFGDYPIREARRRVPAIDEYAKELMTSWATYGSAQTIGRSRVSSRRQREINHRMISFMGI